MNNIQYDFFISYASGNREVAFQTVERIEKLGYKCFIAPRDIETGKEYAYEIIRGIRDSYLTLLIFSKCSDSSPYVLREINSAISRGKTIIPMKIEDFQMSEAMEFYLGPTQWIIAYPEIEDRDITDICNICQTFKDEKGQKQEESHSLALPGLNVCKLSEVKEKLNKTFKEICIREVELDYLCIPTDKFQMNDAVEGLVEDWEDCTSNYEEDTSCILVQDDQIIGYCDFYPVKPESYKILIEGKEIIREDMIDFFSFGGEFDAYIAMVAVDPTITTLSLYAELFKWIYKRLEDWKDDDIIINRFGISVYSSIVDKFVNKIGFIYQSINPAGGKVYEIDTEKFLNNMKIVLKK